MARFSKNRLMFIVTAILILTAALGTFTWSMLRTQADLSAEIADLQFTNISPAGFSLAVITSQPQANMQVFAGEQPIGNWLNTSAGATMEAEKDSPEQSSYAYHFSFSNLDLADIQKNNELYVKLVTPTGQYQTKVNLQAQARGNLSAEPKLIYGVLTDYNNEPIRSGANVFLEFSKPDSAEPVTLSTGVKANGVWSVEYSELLFDLRRFQTDPQAILKLRSSSQLGRGERRLSIKDLLAAALDKQEVVGLKVGLGLEPAAKAFDEAGKLRLLEQSLPPASQIKGLNLQQSLLTTVSAQEAAPEAATPAVATCAGPDNNNDGIADSADPSLCQVGSRCNWQNAWWKECLAPFAGVTGEVKHEWVAFCSADGTISATTPSGAANLYSQVNSNCSADKLGQKLANAALNDSCNGDLTKMASDPGSCATSINGPSPTPTPNPGVEPQPQPQPQPQSGSFGINLRLAGGGDTINVKLSGSTGQLVDQAVTPVLILDIYEPGQTVPLREIIRPNGDLVKRLIFNTRLRVTLGYITPASQENLYNLACDGARTRTETAPNSPAVTPIPDSEILVPAGGTGWIFTSTYNNAGYGVELAGCDGTSSAVEIPVATEIPIDTDPTSGVSEILTNGMCPIASEWINQTSIYQTSTGNGSHRSSPGNPIASQRPTDIKINASDAANLRDNAINVLIVSPVRARVVEVRTPERTVQIFGGGICQDTAPGAPVDPTLPYANQYIGGIVLVLAALDSAGNDAELMLFAHIEAVPDRFYAANDGVNNPRIIVEQGEVIGRIYDGRFDNLENNLVESAYESSRFSRFGIDIESPIAANGCYSPESPHLHFAIISKNAYNLTQVLSTNGQLFYTGNTIDSTPYIERTCYRIAGNGLDNPPSSPSSPSSPLSSLNSLKPLKQIIAQETNFPRPPTPGGYKITINGKQINTPEIIFADNTQQVRYFADTNNDGIRQISERYYTEADTAQWQVNFQKVSETFRYKLERGWNLVGLPFANSDITKASQLHAVINKELSANVATSNSTLSIASLQSVDNYNLYTKVLNQNTKINAQGLLEVSKDFSLTPGKGLFIYVSEPVQFNLSGNAFVSAPEYDLWQGWNLVNLYTFVDQKSRKVLQDGVGAKEVTKIAEYKNGSFATQEKSLPEDSIFGEDFTVNSRSSYFVEVK